MSLINSGNTLIVELNAFAFYYQLFMSTAASGKYAIIAKTAKATPVYLKNIEFLYFEIDEDYAFGP